MRMEPERHPYDLSDSDLALVAVLQDDPRASWANVGAAVGVSAQTARRRWEVIADAGAAWITTHVGPWGDLLVGLVELRCRPGSAGEIAAVLRGHPKIMTITGMTGDHDLVLTIMVGDMLEFRRIVQNALAQPEGVTGVRSTIVTRMFSEGSRWRAVGEPQEQARVRAAPPIDIFQPDRRQWLTVLGVLERDGRASGATVAEAIGVSEPHGRRVLQRLLDTRRIRQRVDVSLEQRLWPHALALWMVVPAARLEATALQIADLPMTRMCAALAGGASNLYVIVWLRDLSEAATIEAEIVRSLEVRVADRALLLHYYKRLGHVFDEENRHEGHVSWLGEG